MTPEARIAVLESKQEEDRKVLTEVSGKLDTVILGLEKQKGFIAGCLFVLVPIWGGIVAAGYALWDWWKDQ